MNTILYMENMALTFFAFRGKGKIVLHLSGKKLFMKLIVNTLENLCLYM